MLKGLAILAFVCIAVVAMPAHNQIVSSHTPSQRQQDAQKTPAPSITPITNNQSTAYYQQEGKEKPQGWHKFVAWPEGVTALAIVFTLFAIVWQSIWTQLSVRATRDSIRLQEMAYVQWVYLDNWRTDYLGDERHQMRIRTSIINQTNFPLTLNSASLRFGYHPNLVTATLGENFFLAPKSPYLVDIALYIHDDQLKAYEQGYYGVHVLGSITYTGVLKRRLTQPIDGILISGKDATARFQPTVPMHPRIAEEDAEDTRQ